MSFCPQLRGEQAGRHKAGGQFEPPHRRHKKKGNKIYIHNLLSDSIDPAQHFRILPDRFYYLFVAVWTLQERNKNLWLQH